MRVFAVLLGRVGNSRANLIVWTKMMRAGARRRLRILLVTAGVATVAVAAGAYSPGAGDGDVPARPPGSFDEGGFAIWPEDTAHAGLESCRARSDSEPWRLSAEATVTRFARQIFGWKRVTLGDDFDARADRIRVLTYGAPVDLDLGNLIIAFRYGDCWFVRNVDYREGGPFPDQTLMRSAAGDTLLELSYRFSSGSGLVMEAGYAGRSRRVAGDNLLRVETIPGETGHFLSTFVNKDDVVVAAAGGPLPSPPNLGAKMDPVERGGFAIYPDADEAYARRTCRDATSYLEYGRHAREPLIGFAMDVLGAARSNKDRRIETSNVAGTSTWIMRTPRLTLRFSTSETTNGCIMLTDVTTREVPIEARVSVARDVVRLDFGALKAAEIEVVLGFGDETSARADPRSPLFIPLRVDRDETGYFITMLRDKRGRLIAAEGHALESPAASD